jgi:hypothetical protein
MRSGRSGHGRTAIHSLKTSKPANCGRRWNKPSRTTIPSRTQKSRIGITGQGWTVRLTLCHPCNRGSSICSERELERVAERHGWRVVEFFEDAGISGAKGRDKRPGLDRLLKAVARCDVDMVAAWSVDRLGRSLIDMLDFLRELHAKGVDLFLHQQGLDTSTPSGRAMFQMLGVFAEFERSMIRNARSAWRVRSRGASNQR